MSTGRAKWGANEARGSKKSKKESKKDTHFGCAHFGCEYFVFYKVERPHQALVTALRSWCTARQRRRCRDRGPLRLGRARRCNPSNQRSLNSGENRPRHGSTLGTPTFARGRAANGSLLQKLRERLDRLPQCRGFINAFYRMSSRFWNARPYSRQKG